MMIQINLFLLEIFHLSIGLNWSQQIPFLLVNSSKYLNHFLLIKKEELNLCYQFHNVFICIFVICTVEMQINLKIKFMLSLVSTSNYHYGLISRLF